MHGLAKTGLLTLVVGSLSIPGRASECRPFEMSVIVDGAPLTEYPWREKTYVEALRGRPFSLRVSNPGAERVAVALSVDGRNVIDARRSNALHATKWVLEPGQTLEIPGWQVSGETARRFFFTETERSYAKWLGDTANVGTIEAVFFREKRRIPPLALPAPRQKDFDERSEAGADTRSREQIVVNGEAPLAAPDAAQAAPRADQPGRAGEAVRPNGPEKKSDGFAATGIGERTSFPVQWVDFQEDPTPAASIALRYEFRRELVRLGVLPRADDLYAREHARGFEPEYAPDPDRHRAQ